MALTLQIKLPQLSYRQKSVYSGRAENCSLEYATNGRTTGRSTKQRRGGSFMGGGVLLETESPLQ